MRSAAAALVLIAIAAPATAQSGAQCCRQEVLDYRAHMMPLQRAIDLAYWAGICQLRSERYLTSITTFAVMHAQRQARALGISAREMSEADADAKQILRTEAESQGGQDLFKRCAFLRSHMDRLDQLDALQSRITGNYH